MDYKSTLRMPKTDFEMRGNLAKKEPGILENWEKNDHYNAIISRHKGQKAFILHDGPPYANGNLHAGTAMNRVIKDFIVRSSRAGTHMVCRSKMPSRNWVLTANPCRRLNSGRSAKNTRTDRSPHRCPQKSVWDRSPTMNIRMSH